MKYILADNAGFCFGVKRAIDTTDKLLDERNNVISLGNIIHNEIEMIRLKRKGLKVVDDINAIKKQDIYLIIRSHGTGIETYQKAKEKNLFIKDLTCPYVSKIHKIVKKNSDDNKKIIIFGDEKHPEVVGIKSWANKKAKVLKTLEEFTKQDISFEENYIVVFQTTFNTERAKKIIEYIRLNYPNIQIYNTICNETTNRQNSVRNVANKVDFMIIIGDKKSSNSKKLYQIASSICPSIFIEDVSELYRFDFSAFNIVGISAGASTPDYTIDKVKKYLEKI